MQANLNHCAAAQDLLVASAARWGVDLVVIAEPYSIPPSAVSSRCGSAVILAPSRLPGTSFERLAAGEGWAAARWGELTVVSCYISPGHKRPVFERILGAIRSFVAQCRTPKILVLGDFNSKSVDWGCPEDSVRGRILRTWVEGSGLRVLNRGSEPTCVRAQGTSIVDVTFATPDVAATVSGWRVMDEETLSDHRYIAFDLRPPSSRVPPRHTHPSSSPRWALKRLDRDALRAAIAAAVWDPDADQDSCPDTESEAAALRDVATNISDACMPRTGAAPPNRRSVYWWSTEIEDLRNACLRARHRYAELRRPFQGGVAVGAGMSAETEMALRAEYRDAREALSGAIGKAKFRAWEEFILTLDQDP
ncbi:uncharacterized protein LOC114945136 [Nylanderia fulva]|uniref:uncharacterized protein LOC114945136 n=1 Tax=Nylanderia fulva TaxID=613905 RepID=UPI0010FB80CF|nr:uncharacterized protein LOC114945136 [Nylanderia fulva]